MNDDAKNTNQNSVPLSQASQAQPQAVIQPAQPVAPVGSANKETGPVTASPAPEFLKPSDVEPQISQDLKELGVEAKKDEPDIGDKQKGVIEHAKQFTPVSSVPSNKITLPMSEEEINSNLKAGQDDDSGKWLAGLLRKISKVIIAMGFGA
jgi:hypothetical protein